MASSSSQRNKNASKPTKLRPNPRRGYFGFRSKIEKNWHDDWFAQRTIVVEWAANLETLDNFEFMPTFARRVGWINFLKTNVGDCNATICREFIGSLIERGDYDCFAFV